MAPHYEAFVGDAEVMRYPEWLAGLIALAAEHGATGGRALDVGCGTGRSLEALLVAGFDASGCDASPRMMEIARDRVGDDVDLQVAALPEVPAGPSLQLVTAVNDIINYVAPRDLDAAIGAMAGRLASGGVLLFDANTPLTFKGFFGRTFCRSADGLFLIWESLEPDKDGGHRADLHAFTEDPPTRVAGPRASAATSSTTTRTRALRRAGHRRTRAARRRGPARRRRTRHDPRRHGPHQADLRRTPSMTPNRERRTPNVEDHEARRVDAADVVDHEGPVRTATVLTAPRCGQDRKRPRLNRRSRSSTTAIASCCCVVAIVTVMSRWTVIRACCRAAQAARRHARARRGPRCHAGISRSRARRQDLAEALDALTADGLIEDAADDARHLDPAGLERYDRQLRYFGDLAGAGVPRAAAQARLEAATVAVLGLGGLGGMAATMLTVCGVGTIVGVDHDVVELSNLARQVLYGQDDLGRPKVEAAADRLGQLNARSRFLGIPRRLDSTAAVADAIAGADFVVAAVDWPADRISGWVNDACWAAGIPYVGMSQHPPLVRVGPTYLPGATGCLTCQEAAYRRRFPLFDAARAAISDYSPAATYAPACGLIGSLVANEAIAHITGLAPVACLGRSTVIDLTTLAVTHEEVPRDPDCRVCGRVAVSTMRPGA